jgi:hypothetical protein
MKTNNIPSTNQSRDGDNANFICVKKRDSPTNCHFQDEDRYMQKYKGDIRNSVADKKRKQ